MDMTDTLCAHTTADPTENSSPSIVFSSSAQQNGFDCSLSPSDPLNIKLLGPKHFMKYAKHNMESMCIFCFHPTSSLISGEHINTSSSMSTSFFNDFDGIDPLRTLPHLLIMLTT